MSPKSSQPLLLQIHTKKDIWDLMCILVYLGPKFGKIHFWIFFDIP